MKPTLLNLPQIKDPRGNLTFLQNTDQIPFTIKRVYWTYDVPGGEIRGGHAYKTQHEVIIALSGSFDVVITHPNGTQEKFSLNRSYYALHLLAKTYRHLENFSTNALSLHLASGEFNENEYLRDFNQYLKASL